VSLDIVKANFARRTEIQGELRSIDEAATADKRVYTESESEKIDALRSELEGVDSRIASNLAIEERSQEMARGLEGIVGAMLDAQKGEIHDVRSLGQRLTASDEYRSWVAAGARGTSPAMVSEMDFRSVTSDSESGGAWIVPNRLGRVGMDFRDRQTFLLDLLPRIPVTTGAVEYVQDRTALGDLADVPVGVAEGSAKPDVTLETEVVTEATTTIAAWADLTRQVVADAPQVQGYVDGRLRYALRRSADAQAIAGSGGSDLVGLLNRTGIVTHSTGDAAHIAIRHGIRLMEDAESVPEIVVLNPADAETFDLTNVDSEGLHAIPNLAGPGARSIWGLTQVRSTAIEPGTALLVDPMSAAVLDRQEIAAYRTDSHGNRFTSNILTLLLEMRIGLALFDPAGVASISFGVVED
jgi:HK97 family phage major capsid protein